MGLKKVDCNEMSGPVSGQCISRSGNHHDVVSGHIVVLSVSRNTCSETGLSVTAGGSRGRHYMYLRDSIGVLREKVAVLDKSVDFFSRPFQNSTVQMGSSLNTPQMHSHILTSFTSL